MKATSPTTGTCAECTKLKSELERIEKTSEERARHDFERCMELVAHVERLARTNQTLLSDDRPSRGREHIIETNECKSRVNEDEQVMRLQLIVMEQARELEELRARARRSKLSGQKKQLLSIPNQDEEEDDQPSVGAVWPDQSTRFAVTPVSLLAQVESKNRRIRELELAVDKLATRLDNVSTKKLSERKESQQVIARLELRVRKYEAFNGNQRDEVQRLERKLAATRAYIAMLERRLVACSSRQVCNN